MCGKKIKKIYLKNIISAITLFMLSFSLFPIKSFAEVGIQWDKAPTYLVDYKNQIELDIGTMNSNPTKDNIKNAINSYLSITSNESSYTLKDYSLYITNQERAICEAIKKLPESDQKELAKELFDRAMAGNSFYQDNSVIVAYNFPWLKDISIENYNKIAEKYSGLTDDTNYEEIYKQIDTTTVVGKGDIDAYNNQVNNFRNEYFNNSNTGNQSGFTDESYTVEGEKCYKRKISYDEDGNVISDDKTYISDDISNCGGVNYNYYYSSIGNEDYDLLNDFYEEKEKEETESNFTLQYTLTKDSDYPIYFDTGIRVSLQNTLTYKNVKDAMYQAVRKSGGQFIEDENKFMGKIGDDLFIFKDPGTEISISEFEALFDKYKKLEVKSLTTKIGQKCTLNDYLEIKRISSINFNDEKIDLKTKPIISDNITLFSLSEIAELLGGTSEVNENSIKLIINNNTFVFNVGSDIVKINGNDITLNTKVKLNSDKEIMGEIQPILDKVNYDMLWDNDSFVLDIFAK